MLRRKLYTKCWPNEQILSTHCVQNNMSCEAFLTSYLNGKDEEYFLQACFIVVAHVLAGPTNFYPS